MPLPVVLCLAVGMFVNGTEQQAFFFDTTKWTGHVFIIPIEKRQQQNLVSDPANWEYLGTTDQVKVRCAPDTHQACQLIVDEKDSYTVIINGEVQRRLRPGVKIIVEQDGLFYYVKNFISPSSSLHRIYNEESSIK